MDKALRDSQERLALAIESAAMGTFDVDFETGLVHWSARMYAIHGIEPGEPMPITRLDTLLLPEDCHEVHAAMAQATDPSGDGRYDIEHRIVWPDGTRRRVQSLGRAQFAFDAGGARRAVRLAGVTQDVTERRQAADHLQQVTQLLQAVGEGTPTMLYLKDATGRMRYCNNSVLQLFGKTADQVIGKTDLERDGPGPQTEAIMANDRQVMETGSTLVAEERVAGTERIFLSTKTPYRDVAGKVIGVAGVSVDITEQRRVEAALRDSEERFRLAVESASLGTFEFDPLAVEWRWSPSVAAFYGFAGEQPLTSEQAFERVHPADRDRLQALLAQMLVPDGVEEYPYRHRIVRPDGQTRHLDIRARVEFEPDPSGSPRAVRVTGVVWDITEHEQLVESLRQADRAKDEFLAMLAHELRNPLAPLTNALTLLDRSVRLAGSDRTALSMAQRQTAQLKRLVDDLLEVSRITRGKIALKREPIRVAPAVRDAAESAGLGIQARAQRLEVRVPEQAGCIEADPARVAQILENLLTNASKYTPAGGTIRLELDESPDEVEIRVVDNGVGIEPADLGKVFELFTQVDATMDRAQGGLGIGLALVRRLVELHGGRVAAHSAGRGQGATFTVWLPRRAPHIASE